MREKDFENRVKAFLKSEGCWFVKYWSGGAVNGLKFTKDGVPDLLVCCNGYFVGLELKAENGHPSKLQLWTIDQIREAGGIAMVVYPHQFGMLKELIRELKKRGGSGDTAGKRGSSVGD